MLAVKAPDLSEVALPIWASRKLNGIRCVIRDGVPLSRKLKAIPNKHITRTLTALQLPKLDGELLLQDDPKGPFSKVSSAVMSQDGWPRFEYHVFDIDDQHLPYWQRYEEIKRIVRKAKLYNPDGPIQLVEHWQVDTLDHLRADESAVVAEGWEGLMLRGLQSPYKYGRSTVREGYLLKVKRFIDDEAEIIGVVELMKNENELEVDDVGYAKRSTAKAGKVPAGTLGALVLRWNSPGDASRALPAGVVEFELGTGYDADERARLWRIRDQLPGQLAKFKYQEVGSKGRPIFASYQGIRDKIDV